MQPFKVNMKIRHKIVQLETMIYILQKTPYQLQYLVFGISFFVHCTTLKSQVNSMATNIVIGSTLVYFR
jgi:hypothetical protein